MRMNEGCSIVNFARVEKEEEIEALAEEQEKAEKEKAEKETELGSFDTEPLSDEKEKDEQ